MSFLYGLKLFGNLKDEFEFRCSMRSGIRIKKTGFVLYRGMAFYKFVRLLDMKKAEVSILHIEYFFQNINV